MNEQIDDKEIKEGSWDSWTEKEERGFVLTFLVSFIGFFIAFFAVICLIS